MAVKEYIIPTEIADAEFDVRFVSPKRRGELADQYLRRPGGGQPTPSDVAKFSDAMADELLAGWRGVTRQTAIKLGYPDFADLPVNSEGEVPYTKPTARKLYRHSFADRFANEIDTASRMAMEAIELGNAGRGDSSEMSPAPTA